MNKKNIISGYKGIMPLDLTNIDKKLHSILIDQHEKDIEIYKMEQAQLPEKLRYENTVMRAEKIHKMDENAQKERIKLLRKQEGLEDIKRIELYNY